MHLFKKKTQENGQSSLETVVRGNTSFALDLYQNLRALKGNLFLSPYSISTALAMVHAGARGNTQRQMGQALHFPSDLKDLHSSFAQLEKKVGEAGMQRHVQLKTANALWPQKGIIFLETFLALTRKFYGAQITPVDFGDTETARHAINSWVEERTEAKIKNLIAPGILNALTRLVLVNAIYFKGDWVWPFDPNLTSEASFLAKKGESVSVPMMTGKHTFRYAEDESLQILELPYSGGDLNMLVLLPAETDGLARLEEALTVGNLDRWTKNMAEAEVDVFLPRFELSFPFRLDETLISMGMVDTFSGNADFSGMNGMNELFIGAMLHKAFVTVNEQGTEAAAATAMVVQLKALSFPAIVFRADHPFVFLIRENGTGSILFIGRISDPAAGLPAG
jgi:serpin B